MTDSTGQRRYTVFQLWRSARVLWLGTGDGAPNLSVLPLPASVLQDPLLRLVVLYNGPDVGAATTIYRLSARCDPPQYRSDADVVGVSKFRLDTLETVEFFYLAAQPVERRVTRCRLYARSEPIDLRHMYRFSRLHKDSGLVVERLGTAGLIWTAPTKWTVSATVMPAQNGVEPHTVWRFDLGATALRWRHCDTVGGWIGHDSRWHARRLWHRMFGQQYESYRLPDARTTGSVAHQRWTAGRSVTVRPAHARAAGWNSAIPYQSWRQALELGLPVIRWN